MKRVLTILAILLLPLSVWAMTPVADSDLSNVTGQSGVNISLDLKMNISIGTMAWGDADGTQSAFNPWAANTDGGYVGINNFNISNLWIRARVETWDAFNSYSILFLKPLTIDVATGTKLGIANTTFVRIGIGAMEISMDAMSFDVALGSRTTSAAYSTNALAGLNQLMGRVSIGALTVYINPWSYVDIYAHAGMGVNFDVNMTIDRISMGYVTWGDTDGLPGGDVTVPLDSNGAPDVANPKYWMVPNGGPLGTLNSAGYVGLRDFNLGDAFNPAVTMNGTVAIDVNTSAYGTYGVLVGLNKFLAQTASTASPFPNGNLSDPNFALAGQNSALATIMGLTGNAVGLGGAVAGFNGWNANAIIQWYISAANAGIILGSQADFAFKPISVVHISFPDAAGFTINVAKMTANVGVGNTPSLVTPQADIFGDIYIQSLRMNVLTGSWVDIWAH